MRGDQSEVLPHVEMLSAVLGIVVIDLVLSGDNAIVIGMAAHRLPPRQRRLAILIGGGAAIVLRITLTSVAALLLTLPGLQAIGGALLLWIAFKLLKEEDQAGAGPAAAASMRGAVATILVADLVMSTDNVLGVAAASEGNIGLLLFGLVLSIAILMLGGSLVATFLNRLWWLAYVGAGVIAWTAFDMLLEDPYLGDLGLVPHGVEWLIAMGGTVVVVAMAHVVYRVRPAHRAP